jgi:uncharacterized iron-regulated protein
MSRETPQSSASLEVARGLLALRADARTDPKLAGEALQQACARVSANLRDAMGEAGADALLARALARTEAHHPALKGIRRLNDGGIHLDGVIANVEADGVATVTAAIEALLATLVDILGRLIGEDMALRLINDGDLGASRNGRGGQGP